MSKSEIGPGFPCFKTGESILTRAPGLEIRVVPVGVTSTIGAVVLAGGGKGTGRLLVPIAVAIPPPTNAPTAKHAACTIVELAICTVQIGPDSDWCWWL